MIHDGAAISVYGGDDEYVFLLYGSTCAEVRLIEPYVSCRLRARAQTHFELHLFSCERCLRAVEFELFVKRAVSDFTKFAQFSQQWH
jgi:hypothetical protein